MNCKHVSPSSIDSTFIVKASLGTCSSCSATGVDLWICLKENCFYVGCGSKWKDHIGQHYHEKLHPAYMNLSSFTVECITCDQEVVMFGQLKQSKLKSMQSRLKKRRNKGMKALNSAGIDETCCTLKSLQPLANCERLCGRRVGLNNLGNTCYMNAALQCLSSCPQLTNYMMSEISVDRTSSHLASEYVKLTNRLWQDTNCRSVPPNSFQNAFVKQNLAFRGYHQQDAHEFIRCLFTSLQNEMKYKIPLLKQSSSENSSEKSQDADACGDSAAHQKLQEEATEKMEVDVECKDALNEPTEPLLSQKEYKTQTKYKTPEFEVAIKSVVSDLFEGTITSTVECTVCNNRSSTQEPFQDLSLPIPDVSEIISTQQNTSGDIEEDYEKMMLDLDDKYSQMSYSEWIWSYWDSMKSTISGWVWPAAVTLDDCLKTFFSADQLTGDNMYSCDKCKKLRNGVKQCRITRPPEVLCIQLKRFRHEGYNSYPTKISCPVKYPLEGLDVSAYMSDEVGESLYDLFAVVVHRGGSGAGGHYTSHALNPIDNSWYEYDDSWVSMSDEASVANAEAYLLFYKKRESSGVLDSRAKLLNCDNSSVKSHVISNEWMFKLFNFSHPGPIDNRNLLCHHGEIDPDIAEDLDNRSCRVSGEMYGYLYNKYGGYAGSKLTDDRGCEKCVRLIEIRESKRENEHKKYMELQEIENPAEQQTCWISVKWLRTWQLFIFDKQLEPPSCEINNKEFAVEKNGKFLFDKYSHYFEISVDAWNFLVTEYGGGPFLAGKNCPPKINEAMRVEIPPKTTISVSQEKQKKQNNKKEASQQEDRQGTREAKCSKYNPVVQYLDSNNTIEESCPIESSVVQNLDSNNTQTFETTKEKFPINNSVVKYLDSNNTQISEDEETPKNDLNQLNSAEENQKLLSYEEALRVSLPA